MELSNLQRNLIEQVIFDLNWTRIKYLHKVTDTKWKWDNGDSVHERFPTISELKNELRSLLEFVIKNNVELFSQGNWVIYWDSSSPQTLSAIFSVRDTNTRVSYIPNDTSELEKQLSEAILSENYELASKLRDQINRIKSRKTS